MQRSGGMNLPQAVHMHRDQSLQTFPVKNLVSASAGPVVCIAPTRLGTELHLQWESSLDKMKRLDEATVTEDFIYIVIVCSL